MLCSGLNINSADGIIFTVLDFCYFLHEHKHQETLFCETAGHSRTKIRNSTFDAEAARLFVCVMSQWSLYSWNITYQSCEVVLSLWYEWKLAWHSKDQKGRTDTSSGTMESKRGEKNDKIYQEIWVEWWKSQLYFCVVWSFAVIYLFYITINWIYLRFGLIGPALVRQSKQYKGAMFAAEWLKTRFS